MNVNNENFDRINQLLQDKMHMVHFHEEIDRYRAKQKTDLVLSNENQLLLIYEKHHI